MSIEQQPEAWIIVNRDTGYRIQVSLFPDLYNKDMFEFIPLYTHPKRELLSIEEIHNGLDGNNGYDDRFVDGVRFAEKHHGIGEEK